METQVNQNRYETVAQFCKRWQLSRGKFDKLKTAGIIPVIQTGPRFIRIKPQIADAALEKYTTGRKQ
jgi:hypothetical protein